MPDTWRMYAVRLDDGLLHYVEHDRRGTAMYGVTPILPVEARLVKQIDPAATHWAWIGAGETKPSLVYPAWPLFSICFPYGVKAEVEAGKGRVVRLAITEMEGS